MIKNTHGSSAIQTAHQGAQRSAWTTKGLPTTRLGAALMKARAIKKGKK